MVTNPVSVRYIFNFPVAIGFGAVDEHPNKLKQVRSMPMLIHLIAGLAPTVLFFHQYEPPFPLLSQSLTLLA